MIFFAFSSLACPSFMSREQNNLLFITALTRHHRRAQHKMARRRLNFRSSSRLSELLYSFSRLVRASPNFSHAIVKGMGWCTRKLIHFCERKLNLMSANPFLLLRFISSWCGVLWSFLLLAVLLLVASMSAQKLNGLPIFSGYFLSVAKKYPTEA